MVADRVLVSLEEELRLFVVVSDKLGVREMERLSDRLVVKDNVRDDVELLLTVPVGDRLVVADTEVLPLGVVETESDWDDVRDQLGVPELEWVSDRLVVKDNVRDDVELLLTVPVGDRLAVADTEALPLGVVEIESDCDNVGVLGGVTVKLRVVEGVGEEL